MMSARGGGEGGTSKADAVRKLSKGGCVKKQTRGEGVKKSENFADIICTCPRVLKVIPGKRYTQGKKTNKKTCSLFTKNRFIISPL